MRKLKLLIWICLLTQGLMAQSRLDNSSFEGDPQDATVPTGWHACEEGSTPDILPGPWQVYLEASEGNTYLGLITRGDGTWESIGQRIKTRIKKDECYKFSIDLAHSRNYASYNFPIKLRVWGAKSKCNKVQMIGDSKAINHQDWRTYKFEFFAEDNFNYIILEAYYSKEGKAYKGNILIDGLSKIVQCTRA